MSQNAHPDQPETLEATIDRILDHALLSAGCLTPFESHRSIQRKALAEILDTLARRAPVAPPAPLAWNEDMTAAPKNGPDFLAKNAKGDIRRCWRPAPSSRTDEIRTFSQQKFAAVAWMPLEALERATSAQEPGVDDVEGLVVHLDDWETSYSAVDAFEMLSHEPENTVIRVNRLKRVSPIWAVNRSDEPTFHATEDEAARALAAALAEPKAED